MNPTEPNHHEEELTRFIDGEIHDSAHSHWHREKESAQRVGQLLRKHLPDRLEPPSAEFLTSQIMDRIRPANPLPAAAERPTLMQRLRVWLAPLATATAIVVIGGIFLRNQSAQENRSFAYTPMPNVKATLTTNDYATVIDLDGLEPVPDHQEIKAFNVASTSSDQAVPGQPQQYFAAHDPKKLLFILFPSQNQGPNIHVMQ